MTKENLFHECKGVCTGWTDGYDLGYSNRFHLTKKIDELEKKNKSLILKIEALNDMFSYLETRRVLSEGNSRV